MYVLGLMVNFNQILIFKMKIQAEKRSVSQKFNQIFNYVTVILIKTLVCAKWNGHLANELHHYPSYKI